MLTTSIIQRENAVSPLKYIPVSTVNQARLQVFQPTRRPKDCQREISTEWGSATIKGKIGQAHADALEAVFRHAKDNRMDDAGRLVLLVDPYPIRKMVGGESITNIEQVWTLLEDLRRVSIDLRADDHSSRFIGGILDLVEESSLEVKSRNGTQRKFWRITLSPVYTAFVIADKPLFYSPEPIARLRFGISQAIARHVLTHIGTPNGGWKIETLIDAVGASVKAPDMKNRRRELRDDTEKLNKCGVIINGNRVFKSDN